MDDFEEHNRTRSPFYPSEAERAAFGLGKAVHVTAAALRLATAASPVFDAVSAPVQVAGNALVAAADVVVSAVDSMNGRAWLAEQSRLLGRPMIEGGFSGPEYNLSVFGPVPGQTCYRCHDPGRVSSGSCSQYARLADAAAVIPAIQPTAAVLGGAMAETVIQALHRRLEPSVRHYGHIRRMTLSRALLPPAHDCPGRHDTLPLGPPIAVDGSELGRLVDAVRRQGCLAVALSEPLLEAELCTVCRRPCAVLATETAWLLRPNCADCGGPWPLRDDGSTPGGLRHLDLRIDLPQDARAIALAAIGLSAGSLVETVGADGRAALRPIAATTA